MEAQTARAPCRPMQEAGYIMAGGFNSSGLPCVSSDTRTGIGFSLAPSAWIYGGENRRAFTTQSGIVCGFAVKLNTSKMLSLIGVEYNNLLGTIYRQLTVFANGENGLTVQTGDGVGVYYSPPNVLFEGVWQYIELKYSPGIGTSYLEVRVDGVAVVSVTNERLITAGASALVNMIDLPGNDVRDHYIDDLYICSTSGSNFNDFLGDCVVHSLVPVSDAGPNQMTQVNGVGGSHFSNVAELPPDDDATYLSSNTSGQKEQFTLSTITADVLQVLAVQLNTTARKQAPGFGSYKSFIVTGGVEADSGSYSAALEYIQTHYVLEAQPNGSPGATPLCRARRSGFSCHDGRVHSRPGSYLRVDGATTVRFSASIGSGPAARTRACRAVLDELRNLAGNQPAPLVHFTNVEATYLAIRAPNLKWIPMILDDVFPNDISYNSVGTIRFATDVIVVDSGDDQRISGGISR